MLNRDTIGCLDGGGGRHVNFEMTDHRIGDRSIVAKRLMFQSQKSLTLFDCADPFLAVESAALGQAEMHRVQSTGHRIELNERDMLTLLLPVSGQIELGSAAGHARLTSGSVAACETGPRETIVRPALERPFEAHAVLVPRHRLSTARTRDFVTGRTARDAGTPDAAAAELAGLFQYLFSVTGGGVDVRSHRSKLLLEALLIDVVDTYLGSAIEPRGMTRASTTAQQKLARKAETLLREQYREIGSIAAVANRLDTSIRSLQTAFNTVHGIGPRAFLNQVRLDRAREMLLNSRGDKSVSTIAFECGFTHLGRFAESYRRRFGERPRDSLKR